MASWEAVIAPAVEPPASRAAPAVRSSAATQWRRRWAALRVTEQALGQCFGARACVWLARTAGLGFVISTLYVAGFAPGALDALLRIALITLSYCAGLAAFSAAGPAPDRILEAGRGLLECRGVPLARLRAERPLAVALWIVRQVGVVALLVFFACLALTDEPRRLGHVLGLGFGAASYVLLLGAGLALLAHVCQVLGRSRGQALFIGLILVPQLLSPAWRDLPTVASRYTSLLDRCLGLESRP